VIRPATRFAAALLLLSAAAAALQLTLLGGARGEDPCAAPGALKATSLIPGTVALGERLEALTQSTIQWSEGEVANPVPARPPMRFQIVRSFDARSLYANPLALAAPELAAPSSAGASELQLQPEELRVLVVPDGAAGVPIHIAWDHTEAPRGPSRMVAWLFLFDNVPVRSPLAAQLASAPSLALGGPRPLTLITISALASEGTAARVEAAAAAWLVRAWDYAARVCTP
jgi:hypothetical protein